ncbi:MAG: CHC2 zinc finger domain-containing protein [Erythrobacter sp.]
MTKWVDFKTVREHLDFRDVLSHYGLKPKGESDQFKIVCPFHDDHKPSCGINRTKQVYHCFACDAGGNALDFIAHMEDLDPYKPTELRKAAMFAAQTFGIDAALERPGKSKGSKKAKAPADDKPKGREAKKVERKCAKPSRVTTPSESAGPVNQPLTFALQLNETHDFIAERGFDPKLISEFGIGYANKGIMNGRICFPIHNEKGELIAYSGRWADGDLPEDVPRYLLPKGFEKSRVLFNLHRVLKAKTSNQAFDTIVVVEGFWSVLRLHGEGIPVVSTFGDSVSTEQVELLVSNGIKKAILIFDGDEAGRCGTKSSLPVLAERLFVASVPLADGAKPDTMSDELVSALPHYQ